MLIKVHSLDNLELGDLELSDELYPSEVRRDIITRVIEWQMAKAMVGSHKTKTRAEVSGTGKKPFAQKGTGRARRGTNRAPQMRGGGVAHGPVIRLHGVKLNKKFRKLGLRHALASKFNSQQMLVVDKLDMSEVSTANLIKRINWIGTRSVLFVDSNIDKNFKMSCANKFSIDALPDVGINVYDIIRHDHLVITQASLKKLEERLLSDAK